MTPAEPPRPTIPETDPARAEQSYRRRLRLEAHPDDAEVWYQLGLALFAQGRHVDSADAYRRSLRHRPDHAETLTQFGVVLAEQGQLDLAVPVLVQAARLKPDHAPAHLNLGVAYAQSGRPADAVRSLEEAVRVQPDYAEAYFNLGNVLRDMRRTDEAITRYREAVRVRPTHVGAHNNLGLTLTETGHPEEAVILLQHAVRLQPISPDLHNNLGLALADLGRFAEAEACYEAALRLDPLYAEAHTNRGSLFKEQDRVAEAIACYDLSLRLRPDVPATRYNRSLALLKAGDYARGFPEYEWRWRRSEAPARSFRAPRWDGSPLDGRTVLLWSEQGLGDTLQFVRFAAAAKDAGGTVVVECPRPIAGVVATCPGVDAVVAEGDPHPPFDVQCPLMSVPAAIGTTLDTVPASVPYLSADPVRVAAWRGYFGRFEGRKVGIVWQGNPRHKWDRFRSMPLGRVARLADGPGVRLFSLQRGFGSEQLWRWKGPPHVEELPNDPSCGEWTFEDTAAVMANLDEVVTVDTASAHLAGALGVLTRVLLGPVTDWRWLVGREDSPWYPSIRVVRLNSTSGHAR